LRIGSCWKTWSCGYRPTILIRLIKELAEVALKELSPLC